MNKGVTHFSVQTRHSLRDTEENCENTLVRIVVLSSR
jgi:hypothetical protein